MKTMTIDWQRLVEAGQTCPRCGDTGGEVRKAAAALTAALSPLGIEVRLTEAQISAAEFAAAPLESNRILVQGRSLEDWVGAETGQSPCCEVCGPTECRTVTVDGTTYESIPADLVVRAGLLAAAGLLAEPGEQAAGCCGPTSQAPTTIPVRSLTVTPAGASGGCC